LDMSSTATKYYAVRTTMGREVDVALVMENRVHSLLKNSQDLGIVSIVIPPNMRGYVFVEATNLSSVYQLMSDIKYVKAGQPIGVSREDVEKLVKPRPVIEMIREGDMVEIVRGPFRGMKAQVMSVNPGKNTVVLSILEAAFEVPIEVPGDYVKPLKKGG